VAAARSGSVDPRSSGGDKGNRELATGHRLVGVVALRADVDPQTAMAIASSPAPTISWWTGRKDAPDDRDARALDADTIFGGEVVLVVGRGDPPPRAGCLVECPAQRRRTLAREVSGRAMAVGIFDGDVEACKAHGLAQLQAPAHVSGAAFLPIWRKWSSTLMKALASGGYPVEGDKRQLETQRSKGPATARRRTS
jgi:hypothetical protein